MKRGGYYDKIMSSGAELDRVKEYLSILGGERQPLSESPLQYPKYPCFPGLNYKTFHDASDFSGAIRLQEAFETIRAEAMALSADSYLTYLAVLGPSQGWQKLLHRIRSRLLPTPKSRSMNALLRGSWTLYPLYYMGVNIEALMQQCPETLKILTQLPRLCVNYPWGDAVFSRQAAHAYLAPHCSVDSLRVRCHLSLKVPKGCEIRVGNEIRHWEEGKCLLFEDSFEHEVWNRSDSDRILLIVDFWHPDLTDVEIAALSAGFRKSEVRLTFYKQRIGLTNASERYMRHLEQSFADQDCDESILEFWPANPLLPMNATLTRRNTLSALRTDKQRLLPMLERKFGYRPLTWFVEPAFLCALLYRLSRYYWVNGHLKTGRLLMQLNSLLTGADIHPGSTIGTSFLIPSPCGTTFSGNAGQHLTLMSLSGTGGSFSDQDVGAGNGLPVLGDHVVLNRFVGVQGPIRVGDGVEFFCGSCTTADVASRSTVQLAVRPSPGIDPPQRVHAQSHVCLRHRFWKNCKSDISTDIDRYLVELALYHSGKPGFLGRASAFLTNSSLAAFIYRLSHWLYVNCWPRSAAALSGLNVLLFKINIHPASCIGPSLYIPHPTGLVFNGKAGRGLSLFDNGICSSVDGIVKPGLTTSPILGDHVSIGGHAGVIGAVTLGDNVKIAPKVQVAQDISANTQVFSPMARSIQIPEPTT